MHRWGTKKSSYRENCKGQLALTVLGERRLRRIIHRQRSQTLTQIATQLNDGDSRTVSKWTMQRSLHRMGFDWKRVAWSDESRFRLLNADGRLRIWRQAHEAMDTACQVGTVQGHGGSIMVRGVFSWHCLGSLVRVPTYLNEIRYVELLGDHLHPFMLFCYPHGVEGHHTAPTNINGLETALANIWQIISVERFQKLIESMPHHVAAVMKARGGPSLVTRLVFLIQWHFSLFR
ncbi:transposable element Tc1 transposase [Trichonephila clavipes]|uniref:Transposable element Tc1 transposase n=1 Tax=Trichonephila clavipes TaxID=2585209 RepID=A0A8X6W127_TRICX|nr:transposable element Tc1 transposase [Trichonephila clavipes]